MRQACAQSIYSFPLVGREPVAGGRTPAEVVRTQGGKKMVSIKGKATPLFWADQITQIDDLDDYVRTGFNTVVVHVMWRPSEDGALVAEDWEPQRDFAEAAAKKGLYVIYSLPPAPLTQERAFRFSGDNEAYLTLWSTWAQSVIEVLSDTTNLIGWMLPDDPRSLPFIDDTGFRQWLTARGITPLIINGLWGMQVEDLEDLTIDATVKIVEEWRTSGTAPGAMTEEEMRAALQKMQQKPAKQNFAIHPAALALALYRWDAYRGLLDAWARVIKEADEKHLVFSGRLTDYAQLLSVPPRVDVSISEVRPDIAEGDLPTHNPHQINIARRGGSRAVIPVLSTAGSDAVPEENIPHMFTSWSDAAVAHGASGLIVDSWEDLRGNTEIHRAVRETLRRLTISPRAEMWMQAPIATVAVVLTPLADGHTMQPPPGMPGEPRGLYGFGNDLVTGEPSALAYSLRWGTSYGGVDFLSPDDFDGTGQAVARYSTILLPQALTVPGAMAHDLSSFVAGGGVIVADLGLGAADAGNITSTIPPTLASLFGVVPHMELRPLSCNLRTIRPHPLLPHWNSITTSRGGAVLTGGDGPSGAAFTGPVGFAELLPQTSPLALAFEYLVPLNERNGNRNVIFRRSWLTARAFGRGYAIYAPFRLWTHWSPGYTGYDSFHGDLFIQRQPAVVDLEATSLVPLPRAGDGMTPFAEIANFPQQIAVLNHNPFPQRDVASHRAELDEANIHYSVLETAGVGNFLWNNAVCVFSNSNEVSFAAGRPAPIANPDEFESQPHRVRLHVLTKPQTMSTSQLIPVRALNLGGGSLTGRVDMYSPRKAEFALWPNDPQLEPTTDRMKVTSGEPSPVRLTLYHDASDEAYHIRPGSRHRVVIVDLTSPLDSDGNHRSETRTLTANDDGQLIIEAKGAAIGIEVSPAQ